MFDPLDNVTYYKAVYQYCAHGKKARVFKIHDARTDWTKRVFTCYECNFRGLSLFVIQPA